MQQVLKGNHAVSRGVQLSRVQVISAYPITPQTTIVEALSELCARGELTARFIKVESEHSALAALIGSASAGARSFTATSSQGLLLMHEVLHWTAGARLPIVLTNVNRAVAPGWNIWADQTDSVSQRDTGWIQIYAESNQEVLDSVILAYRLAETVLLPVMITYDAFFLSHTSEIVDVPDAVSVDAFLPPYRPPYRLDVTQPKMFGGMIGPDFYYEQRYRTHREAMDVLDRYPEICAEFQQRFGRPYDLTETYRAEDAEVMIATAGTTASVSRIAVDRLRQTGIAAGLMKIRMLRPSPKDSWRRALSGASRVVVIDRNLTTGAGGVFADEIRNALYAAGDRPGVFSAVAGLGGRDVTPDDVCGIVRAALDSDSEDAPPIYWGLKE
ncbi:MAG TPA: pyruvate ferredoxin oxidoreductase [Desulfobacterales bacterium]